MSVNSGAWMKLFKFEGVIFVEAADKREAEARIAAAFKCSSSGKRELPFLHWWSRLRSSLVSRQPCCGVETPAHTPKCPHSTEAPADLENRWGPLPPAGAAPVVISSDSTDAKIRRYTKPHLVEAPKTKDEDKTG